LVLGEQPETCARLADLCCELGVSGIVFSPQVPHGQVADYLLAADLGLLLYPPSSYLAEFSSPLKLFEYLACGLPVIATALSALQEIVEDGINGRLVAPDDPETIAAVIVETAGDERLLRRLGAGALASARRYHYVERARRIEAAIAPCLGRQTIAEDSRCFST
jgi:glycosyltransferase involved in cell wall biosynthesis